MRQELKRSLATLLTLTLIAAAAVALARGNTEPGEFNTEMRERRWALVIGINHYDSEVYPNLDYPRADAYALADRLTDPSLGLFSQARTIVMTDDREETDLLFPSKEHIIDKLRWISQQAESADMILFYFSGHGNAINGINYVAPHRGDYRNPGDRMLSLSFIFDKLETANAQTIVTMVDACRAGTKQGVESLVNTEPLEGRYEMYSSAQGGFSYDDEKLQHSVFTAGVLQALYGDADIEGNGDQQITIKEVARFVKRFVDGWAAENVKNQAARFGGEFQSDPESRDSVLALSKLTLESHASAESDIDRLLRAVQRANEETEMRTGRRRAELKKAISLSRESVEASKKAYAFEAFVNRFPERSAETRFAKEAVDAWSGLESHTTRVREADGMREVQITWGTNSRETWIDRHEITEGQFRLIMGRDSRCSGQGDQHPAVCVTYSEAEDYCQSVNRELLSGDVWRAAAGKGLFPWGDSPVCEGTFCRANVAGSADGFEGRAPVCSFPPSKLGFCDLVGNVEERAYDSGYNDSTFFGWQEARLRGGSYRSAPSHSVLRREAPRIKNRARREDVGFRCMQN